MDGFTYVDGIVALILVVSAILAYSRGLVRETMAIAGWIVAAIAAEPAVSGERLRAVMSRAALMVASVQVPVVAVLYVFGDALLAAFGDGDFSGGSTPLLVLTTGWLVTSTVGLSGVALYARGHGGAHLFNTLATLLTVVGAGFWAIPRWDLVGAAVNLEAAVRAGEQDKGGGAAAAALHLIALSRKWRNAPSGIGFKPKPASRMAFSTAFTMVASHT